MRITDHSGLAHTRWGQAFGVTHGPKKWPRRKFVAFSVVQLAPHSKGYKRLWVYTRWGDAWCIDWRR
jgi:hypothetical protein